MPVELRTRLACIFAGGLLCTLVRADTDVSFDFLDYLGEMVEVDGDWVDPVALDTDNAFAADTTPRDAVPSAIDLQNVDNDVLDGNASTIEEETGEL